MKCPECNANLSARVLVDSDSGMTFKIKPNEGQLLHAKTLASVIKSTATIIAEIAKEQGTAAETLIAGIDTDDSGEISIRFLIAKSVQPEHKP